jgi:cysteinyl-tRNA synthetase
MVEGEKMSKSLGNFFTLRDLVEKDIKPITFRYAIQSNHYRKLLNFSFEGLKAADNSLKRIRAFRKRMEADGAQAGGGTWKEALDPMGRLEKARTDFWAAMADDLNTPEALAAMFTLISDLNAQDDRIALTREERDAVLGFLDETDAIFAAWPKETLDLDAEVEALIAARKAARDAKNWAEGDRIRDQLKAMGIVLEDRKDGTVGWRKA